jgi:hypothetical protein
LTGTHFRRFEVASAKQTRLWILGSACLGLLGAVALALVALKSSNEQSLPKVSPRVLPEPRADVRFFAANSFWNRPLADRASIDRRSKELVAGLTAEVDKELRSGIGPWVQTTNSSTPVFVAHRGTRRTRVRLDAPPNVNNASLRAAWSAVPIPRGAAPAAGADRHMTVWSPSEDKLWEFWKARKAPDGWHARWGGAIAHVSSFSGLYSPAAWPGSRYDWGSTASSLPVVGGTILLNDLKRGAIDHALALDVPHARAGEFAWPAQRTDGNGTQNDLPEGAILRIPASVDLGELDMPRPTRLLADAAQRYGIVVRDQTNHAIGFYAEDPVRGRGNPYNGSKGFLEGKYPNDLLASFPWNHLQVLKMNVCRRAPCRKP